MRLCLLIPPGLELSSAEGQIALAWMEVACLHASAEGADLLCMAPVSFHAKVREAFPANVVNLTLAELLIARIRKQDLPKMCCCEWPKQIDLFCPTYLLPRAFNYLIAKNKRVIHSLFFPASKQTFSGLIVTPQIDVATFPKANYRRLSYVVTFTERQAAKLRQAVDVDSSSVIYQPLGLSESFVREQARVPKGQSWKMQFNAVELGQNYVLIILYKFVKEEIEQLLLALHGIEQEVVFSVSDNVFARSLQKLIKKHSGKKQPVIVNEDQFPSAQSHLIIHAGLVLLPQPDLDAGLTFYSALNAGKLIQLPRGTRGYDADLKGVNYYRVEELAAEIKLRFQSKVKRHETTRRIRTMADAFKEMCVIYRRL